MASLGNWCNRQQPASTRTSADFGTSFGIDFGTSSGADFGASLGKPPRNCVESTRKSTYLDGLHRTIDATKVVSTGIRLPHCGT